MRVAHGSAALAVADKQNIVSLDCGRVVYASDLADLGSPIPLLGAHFVNRQELGEALGVNRSQRTAISSLNSCAGSRPGISTDLPAPPYRVH
jgi:hypothetical protein